MEIGATGYKTAAQLQEADNTATEQKQAEIKAKRQQELEGSIGNKLSNLTGIDTDNFGENATGSSIFGGVLQVATSPITATCNIAGGIMGADMSKTNSYDGQSSGLGGLFGSIGNVFKGFGNVLGGCAKAISPQTTGTQQQQQTQQTGQQQTQQTQQTTGQQKLFGGTTITINPDGSTVISSGSGSTTSTTGTEQKAGSASTPTTSGSTTTTPTTTDKTSAQKTGTSNFKLGSLTHGTNGNVTSTGSTADINTEGYEAYDGTVRAAVEEYTEASSDLEAANSEFASAEKEYNDLSAKVSDEAQKNYAEAKGDYDGATQTINNLNSKLSSLSADIQGQRNLLSDSSVTDDRKSQIEQTIKNLESNMESVKNDLKAAEEKRDNAQVKMAEAEKSLNGASASSDANKLAGAKAKMEAAKAKAETSAKLKDEAKTQAETASKAAKEKGAATKANREATEKECSQLDSGEKSTYVAKKAESSPIFDSGLKTALANNKDLDENSQEFKDLCKKTGVSEAYAKQGLKVAKARTGNTGAAETKPAQDAKEPEKTEQPQDQQVADNTDDPNFENDEEAIKAGAGGDQTVDGEPTVVDDGTSDPYENDEDGTGVATSEETPGEDSSSEVASDDTQKLKPEV